MLLRPGPPDRPTSPCGRSPEGPQTCHTGRIEPPTKVLVVDDEPLIVKMLARFARAWGYEPVMAHDGLEAWELFRDDPDQWSFIITDILMPRLDGVALVERVRRSGSDLPVVFISAHGQIPDVEALSPATFLAKPFLRAELFDAMKASAPRPRPPERP